MFSDSNLMLNWSCIFGVPSWRMCIIWTELASLRDNDLCRLYGTLLRFNKKSVAEISKNLFKFFHCRFVHVFSCFVHWHIWYTKEPDISCCRSFIVATIQLVYIVTTIQLVYIVTNIQLVYIVTTIQLVYIVTTIQLVYIVTTIQLVNLT